MKNTVRKVSGLVIMLLLASGIPAIAQRTSGALTVPVTGSNSFSGTATINGFVNQGGQIVAFGTVANSTHTAFAAGVTWPVTLNGNTAVAYSGPTPAVTHLTKIAWSPDRQNGARLVPVQMTGSSCGVLTISLGATMVNLAGASVSLPAITFTVSGQTGTPVGGIVCSLLSVVNSVGGLVGSVGNIVSLLNNLLSGLTGSLGGITGGLAGGLPGVGGATGGL